MNKIETNLYAAGNLRRYMEWQKSYGKGPSTDDQEVALYADEHQVHHLIYRAQSAAFQAGLDYGATKQFEQDRAEQDTLARRLDGQAKYYKDLLAHKWELDREVSRLKQELEQRDKTEDPILCVECEVGDSGEDDDEPNGALVGIPDGFEITGLSVTYERIS